MPPSRGVLDCGYDLDISFLSRCQYKALIHYPFTLNNIASRRHPGWIPVERVGRISVGAPPIRVDSTKILHGGVKHTVDHPVKQRLEAAGRLNALPKRGGGSPSGPAVAVTLYLRCVRLDVPDQSREPIAGHICSLPFPPVTAAQLMGPG